VVTALSLSRRNPTPLNALGATPLLPSALTDSRSLAGALTSQDVVVHAASPIEVWGGATGGFFERYRARIPQIL
jgi:hypothetical protein